MSESSEHTEPKSSEEGNSDLLDAKIAEAFPGRFVKKT